MKTNFKLILFIFTLTSCTKEVIIEQPNENNEIIFNNTSLKYDIIERNIDSGTKFINLLKSNENTLIIIEEELVLDNTITNNFDLKTENKIIQFIENGRLIFKDDFKIEFFGYIIANEINHIFNIDDINNTPFIGKFKNENIFPEWFGAKSTIEYNVAPIVVNGSGCNSLYEQDNFYNNSKPIQFTLNTAKGFYNSSSNYDHQKFYYGGNKVKLQNGFYPIHNTIHIPSGIEFIGNGQTKTWITDVSECGLDPMLEIHPEISDDTDLVAGNIKINNIGFRGLGANSSNQQYWLTKQILNAENVVYNFIIDDCRFEKSNNLIDLVDCYGDVIIKNSNLSYGIDSALELSKCHSFTLENCRIENTKNSDPNTRSSALVIYKGQPITINNSIFQYNDCYAIYASQANQLNITNCYFEDNFINTTDSSSDTSVTTGAFIISLKSPQINIVNNTFTFEREISGDKPVMINIVHFIDTRLVQFHGNRITNDLTSDEINDENNPIYNIDKAVAVTDINTPKNDEDEDEEYRYNTSFFGYYETDKIKTIRDFIINNNFVNTSYTRSLGDAKPDYLN